MRRTLIILILVLLVSSGGYFIYSRHRGPVRSDVWDLLQQEHSYVKRFLNVLWQVIYRSEKGSSLPSAEIYNSIKEAFSSLIIASHFAKEEQIIFPYFKSGLLQGADLKLLENAERDHEDIRYRFAELNLAFEIKNVVSFTQNLMALEGIFTEHLFMEDEKLFPAFRYALNKDKEEELLKLYKGACAYEDKSGLKDLYKFYIIDLEKEYGGKNVE